jgi:hypothetical protein
MNEQVEGKRIRTMTMAGNNVKKNDYIIFKIDST